MGVVRNGRNREGIVTAGKASTSVIVAGVDRLEGTPNMAVQFMLSDAGIIFEVSQSGTITLTRVQGTFVDTNYENGDEIGINNDDITLTGSIRVPNDDTLWTNNNQLVTITGFTRAQLPTDSSPDVQTDAATSKGATFATLNGQITDLHGSVVDGTGFYYIEDADATSAETQLGTKVSSAELQTEVGSFTRNVSGLTQGATYSFLAYAESDFSPSYGDVETFTTTEAAATADWIYTNVVGQGPTGGTSGTTTYGAFGAWGPAVNTSTTSVSFDTDGVTPVSAKCDPGELNCSISRSRTFSTPITGASQAQTGVCIFTTGSVASTLRCEDSTATPTTGVAGDTNTRNASVDYNDTGNDTETRSIGNSDYVPDLPEFAFSNLGYSATISSQGVISSSTDVAGTITTDPPDYGGDDLVDVSTPRTFDVLVTGVTVPTNVPPVFSDEGATGQSYPGTYTTNQPAQVTLAAPSAVLTITQGVAPNTTDYVFRGIVERQGVDLVPGSSYSVAIDNEGGKANLIPSESNNLAGPYIVPAAGEGRGHGGTYTNATDTSKVFATVRGEE